MSESSNISEPTTTKPLFPSSSSHSTSITSKLSDDNYHMWISQVLPQLRGHQVLGYVDGSTPCPPRFLIHADGSIPTLNPAYDEWQRQDQLLLSWLISSLSVEVHAQVIGLSTSHDVWTSLETSYAAHSRARVLQLRMELQSLKKGPDSIQKYFQRAKTFAHQLALAGRPVCDEDLILSILAGLPSEYGPFRTSISTREEAVSMSDLLGYLLTEEFRIHHDAAPIDAPPAANVIVHASSPPIQTTRGYNPNRGRGSRFRGRGRGRQYGHSRSNTNDSSSSPSIQHRKAAFREGTLPPVFNVCSRRESNSLAGVRLITERKVLCDVIPLPQNLLWNRPGRPTLNRPRVICSDGSLYRPLVEVFSVQIMNINKVCNIYGTIRLVEGIELQHLYNRIREESESESVDPGDDVLLIGPVRTISGYGNFVIYVDLMDKDTDLPLVTRGLMPWNVNRYGHLYDQPTSGEVDGDYGNDYDSGSVIVNYIMLTHAVEATVTVTLLVGHGEDPSHVYGRITACNSTFSEGSLLFRKKSDEHIDVRPGQLIPLSRSVVAVPFNSVLIVQVDMWDCNAISSDMIAKGTAEFHTVFSGKLQKPLPELLQEYDMAIDVFPWDATNYEFNEEMGQLTVLIPSVCEVGYKDSSVLRFANTVTGYVEKGKLADVEGMKTKVMIWVKVTSISIEGSKIHFTAGMKKTRSREAYEVLRDGVSVDKF
ncbi:hypothetical protein HHK36_018800 [Tetracentron sinense]|uniref:DUF6598 domain-containing protein n=1 Tax=Tetracentron sinense TaxID=13715 RepID=A0A835D8K6_TETSI|nr:hypothetical protein HHK36_018800 [Tetracentron sinense]